MIPSITKVRENTRIISEELCRDGKGWILGSVAAGWFLSIGIRYVYPSLLPFFRSEFGLGLTVAGLLLTVLWVGYALGQFPGGILGDVIGEGNILVVSTILSTAAVIIVTASFNIYILFVGTALFGLATSLYGPTRFTIFTDIYPTRAGTAVGLSHSAGSIGNTILPAFAATVASYYTWRLGFGITIPAFIGIAIALFITVPSRTSERLDDPENEGNYVPIGRILSAVRKEGIPIIVLIQIFMVFISQGFLGFYPTYLVEIKGFTPQTAAIVYGFYFAVGILIQPLAGLSNDRFGPRATLAILAGGLFTGMLLLYFSRSIVPVLLVSVLVSSRNGTGVVTNTFIADALYDDVKGSGLGFLRTCWLLIGASSPLFVGYLGDLGMMIYAFLILTGVAGVATLLTVFVPQSVE